jgi:phthiocerol/phenolphthiocerol synthesis type-I polyketide synthase C
MFSHDSNPDSLVAVVGMAGRFPGAPDTDALWRLLSERRDGIRPVPKERWDAGAQLDPEKPVQSVGGFLDGVDQFDPTFFGISPREAEDIDPQQRLMLEASWTALEDGGQRPETLSGTRTGVYVGASWHDYEILRKDRGVHPTQHTAVGNALDVVAARVSYFYKLKGPSLTVETGCSSAMVALHLACRALTAGEIDGAIVGGVNLILAPDVSVGLTRFGGLSPDGRCKAFAATANGFVRGEGVIALYMKTLARALADGDRIHGVIVRTAVNNDGGGDSLVTPSPDGQEDLLRRVYAEAAVPLDDVLYIEAHGTGTAVGDPIEAGAIGRVIGQRRDRSRGPLAIGSVKTNIGHLEATAGLAGVVKSMLAIRHGVVPPNLHAETLNPSIPFAELGLEVVREPFRLPEHGQFYVGVNSFGWGGTNAHAILAPPPERPAGEPQAAPEPEPQAAPEPAMPVVLPISAHHDASLRQRAADVRDAAARRSPASPGRSHGGAATSPAARRSSPATPRRSARRSAASRRRATRPRRLPSGQPAPRARSPSSSPARERSGQAWERSSSTRARPSRRRSAGAHAHWRPMSIGAWRKSSPAGRATRGWRASIWCSRCCGRPWWRSPGCGAKRGSSPTSWWATARARSRRRRSRAFSATKTPR